MRPYGLRRLLHSLPPPHPMKRHITSYHSQFMLLPLASVATVLRLKANPDRTPHSPFRDSFRDDDRAKGIRGKAPSGLDASALFDLANQSQTFFLLSLSEDSNPDLSHQPTSSLPRTRSLALFHPFCPSSQCVGYKIVPQIPIHTTFPSCKLSFYPRSDSHAIAYW